MRSSSLCARVWWWYFAQKRASNGATRSMWRRDTSCTQSRLNGFGCHCQFSVRFFDYKIRAHTHTYASMFIGKWYNCFASTIPFFSGCELIKTLAISCTRKFVRFHYRFIDPIGKRAKICFTTATSCCHQTKVVW